jgi:high affinity Mn2+ porin
LTPTATRTTPRLISSTGRWSTPQPSTLEAYYSYTLTPSTRLTFDYQFLKNPGYNADRGPANIFAARAHWQF